MSKKIYFILMALLMVLTVSCVSAAEDVDNSTAVVDEQVEVLTAIEDVSLESNDDADVLSAGDANPNLNIRPSVTEYGDVSFRATVEPDATGTINVKFSLDGEQVKVNEDLTIKDGAVSWGGTGTYLPKGNYVVTGTYNGDSKYASATATTDRFNVARNHVNLDFTNLAVNEKGNIVADAVLDNERATGKYNVVFTNLDTGKSTTVYGNDVKSKGIIAYEGAPLLGGGEYKVSLLYIGTDEYFPVSQTKNINVSEIVIENETIELEIGGEIDSGASLNPADAGDLTFVSSNESVVTVNADGLMTGVSLGNATVTVSCAGNDKYGPAITKTITVTVENAKTPTNISVDPTELALKVDEKAVVKATLTPADAGTLNYTSSNSAVVTVDKDGNVVAVGEGEANITVSYAGDDTYAASKAVVTVTVSKIATEINITSTTGEMALDAMIHVSAELNPSEAGNLTYVSNDTDVATVSPTGIIVGNKVGTALITVSFAGNDKYAAAENKTVTITVNLKPASISVNKDTLDLVVNDTFTIVPTTSPEGLNVTYIPDNSGVVSVDENGKVTALKGGVANITVKIVGNDIYVEDSTTVTVNVNNATEIDASDVTAVYNVDKNLVITLKDASGKPISGASMTIDLNGEQNYTTDENGQVTVSTKGLDPNTYTAKITFEGDSKYDKSAKDVKVTVKKATPKITAKAKTFKSTTKTKKYTITLKDNVNKAISKATVYLKVGGKTYKATTNSKGQATFKITKLSKTGTFKATITYKGDKYYNKVTKKATIKVKSVWKTVAKGSKKTATVKKIQKALKKNGYYLEYNGHYLKVDGIYQKYTQMAVKEFQKAKGLKVTGKVDEKTAKKLKLI